MTLSRNAFNTLKKEMDSLQYIQINRKKGRKVGRGSGREGGKEDRQVKLSTLKYRSNLQVVLIVMEYLKCKLLKAYCC